MKKILYFFLMVLGMITFVSCGEKESSRISSSTTETPSESKGFIIHYYRSDATYDPWCLWLWENGKEGAIYQFNGEDSYGAYYIADWAAFSPGLEDSKLGFIIRKDTEWTKDYDQDRFFEFKNYDYDSNGYYNIYLKSGEGTIYTTATNEVNDMINSCTITYDKTTSNLILNFKTNKEFSGYEIYSGSTKIADSTVLDTNVVSQSAKELNYSLGSEMPDLSQKLSVKVTFKDSKKTIEKVCNVASIYRTELFDNLYTYDGQLGAIYSKEKTIFRVWSPVSSAIKLRIYDVGTPKTASIGGTTVAFTDGSDDYTEYNMTKGEKGTWEYTISGDIEGKYYTYVVTNSNFTNEEIVDPYAKSTGINGLRGMVVDFSKTNPDGWDDVKLNGSSYQGLVVYETHIADVTSSDTWNGTKENQKTFVGFYEAGTMYQGVTTGFDHIKELGVNAVQIIPFFDASNDERLETRTFNWGYNPLNYNSLDGIYSKNPYDGYEKIKEFKNLVQAYSNAGINIIMDVVYNHVNGLDRSNFDVLMPNYYFRYNGDTPSNGSGCGNETASEMPMFRKFMIDSTEFWASEYKIGGFRFDLMGLHDIETMNKITSNLHTNVDKNITVYGEPWAGGSAGYPTNYLAMQSNMTQYEGFGCFNDQMRDALIKGGLCAASEKGWITGTSRNSDTDKIVSGITGKVLSYISTHETEKCVNYVTCHDNYTLYDRIKAAGITDEETIEKMAMLAQSVVLTSQGVKFMLAGEEFLRTKGGNSNSYNASYAVNELDYSLKIKNSAIFENYKKLIELHNSTDLFSKSSEECKLINVSVNSDTNLIVYELEDTINNRVYKIVHSNGYTTSQTNVVDLEGYTLYLDTLNTNDLVLSSNTVINSYQTIIAYKNK